MKNGRVRFGLIGAGGIAQSYLQAFEHSTCAELAAVADTRHDAARTFAQRANCQAYASHGAMIEAANVDAVLICTPPVTHAPIAVDVLRRGINVLCEKPLTVDVASAHRMLRAARANGVLLTMASKFRYVKDVVRAKEMVQSGAIGDIVMIENSFASAVDMSSRWNADAKVSGGGVLIDNGTHSVDLLRYFLGALRDVQVFEGTRVQQLEVEDTVHVFVRNQAGAIGRCDLSWSINTELETYLRIYGSRGTILVGWKESRLRQAGGEWVVFGAGYDKVQAFSSQLDNFARAIGYGEPMLVSAEDALASVEVVNTAYEVLCRNRWTAVKPPSRQALLRLAPSARANPAT